MGVGDIEKVAEDVYRCAGFGLREPASPLQLAHRLLGPGTVRTVGARPFPGDAALVRVFGQPRIYLRGGIGPVRTRFALCHELAHFVLGVGSDGIAAERLCDALGAALLAPRPAFMRALEEVGERYRPIARWFVCSESCAALRLGECTGQPVALVAPESVRVRGDGYAWPGEPELRRLAKAPRLPGLKRARLRDDPRRAVLRPAS